MNDTVSWIFDVQLKDGKEAAWRDLMHEMIEATMADEPGALEYQWAATTDGKNWQIHECYADSAAAMIHNNTFGQRFAGRFFACVTPTRMVVYGAPSDEVKASLAGLSPAYMGSVAGFTR